MLRAVWTMLATALTLAVLALSMAMNFAFGYGLGTTQTSARILGSLSVACDGLKALLPLFIAWQWAEHRRLAAASGALLFLLLLTWGSASAIGFAAENRAAFTGQRETKNAALHGRDGPTSCACGSPCPSIRPSAGSQTSASSPSQS
jgi:phosphotransferase system  glucose/maltose/N-acetylglucosamine-specific IIC component